jgi:hypothetical protein
MNTCLFCNQNFHVYPYRKDTARFCSKDCFNKSKKGIQPEHLKKIVKKGVCMNSGRTHFKKGFTPWNKNMKGIHLSSNTEFKKGLTPWNKGFKREGYCPVCNKKFIINQGIWRTKHKTCSKKCRIEAIKMARSKQIITNEHKMAISLSLRGKSKSKEHIAKISGANNYHWKGGDNNPLRILRSSFAYKEWRRQVFRRDYWTCQICGEKKRKIWADHIKPFALYPELRFDINNGRTVCEECALKLPTHGNKVFNIIKEI